MTPADTFGGIVFPPNGFAASPADFLDRVEDLALRTACFPFIRKSSFLYPAEDRALPHWLFAFLRQQETSTSNIKFRRRVVIVEGTPGWLIISTPLRSKR